VALNRVTLSGATGLIGRGLARRLAERGVALTVLSRSPERARARLQDAAGAIEAVAWDPLREPAPPAALQGSDAVVHLAGERVDQRWSEKAKSAIRDSRVTGTSNLIAGLAQAEPRPATLVCASAVGYSGARGEEPLDEEAPAGADFLAEICASWEAQAERARSLQMRVVRMRVGVVLAAEGGALARMLPPFRLGLGGPVGRGDQYLSWIALDDLLALMLAALEDERFSGAVNATAPEPVTSREFARELGHALRRPARLPVPALALRALFGEMAQTITTGARVMPARALMLGFRFRHPELDEALRATLGAESGEEAS
jgi:uncharacterized protein (TIGR01777 family)